MRVVHFHLRGVRSFDKTGDIFLHPKFNIFVGKNNTGKTTLLNAILLLQYPQMDGSDARLGIDPAYVYIQMNSLDDSTQFANIHVPKPFTSLHINYPFRGSPPFNADNVTIFTPPGPIFVPQRPHHKIVPFLSKRKAANYQFEVHTGAQNAVTGNLAYLNARVDHLVTSGHPDHKAFLKYIDAIIGLKITTTSHPNGKQAGFYFGRENFIPIEKMGEGVSEMVALIVELCTERNKVFVIEEPEANIHPEALKSLLELFRISSEHNQFIIATHSNVVVREIGAEGKLFRVYNDSDNGLGPSQVEEVPADPISHVEILKELGYTFADFNLYEGWLFLEESSAETIITNILIPLFVPEIEGKIRTFSSAGVNRMDASLDDFIRLVTFTYLQPVYKDKLWVVLDGDSQVRRCLKN